MGQNGETLLNLQGLLDCLLGKVEKGITLYLSEAKVLVVATWVVLLVEFGFGILWDKRASDVGFRYLRGGWLKRQQKQRKRGGMGVSLAM